jgi:MFS family permease
VSLSVEALPHVSKPLLAGVMGAAANVGFVLLGLLCYFVAVTPEDWRWVLAVCSLPAVLGVAVLSRLPESPSWLAARRLQTDRAPEQPLREILRPPLLRRTVIGIALGAIPVVGTAANANWLIPWSDQAASARTRLESAAPGTVQARPSTGDPRIKAWTQVTRSSGAILGSLLGGWIASLLGRRLTYFLISLASFLTSLYIYQFLDPLVDQRIFNGFAFLLGFVGVTYFGWLPLYLPELFPTRVRATGTGVTFNSGRILAAACVLGTGLLMNVLAGDDYAQVGTWTALVYVLGMVVICFAPDTTRQPAED